MGRTASTGGQVSQTLPSLFTLQRSTSSNFASPVTVAAATSNTTLVDEGRLPQQAQTLSFTQLAASGSAVCGIATGRAFCWGSSSNGQLGNGTTSGTDTATATPVVTTADNTRSELPAGVKLTSIQTGYGMFCATDTTNLYCWGVNSNGMFGKSLSGSQSLPVKISTLPSGKILSFAIASSHVCAVVEANGAYCWGNNSVGQLGISATTGTGPYPPTKVVVGGSSAIPAGATITGVSAGTDSSCVIAGGWGYCFGNNLQGNLGIGTSTTAEPLPKKITVGSGSVGIPSTAVFSQIALANGVNGDARFGCAIANGIGYCWGNSNWGQTGLGSTGNVTSPRAIQGIPAGTTATDIESFYAGACLVASGKGYCWGWNGSGQAGTGTNNPNSYGTAQVTTLPSGKVAASVTGQLSFRCWTFTDGSAGCIGSAGTGVVFGEGPGGRTGDVFTIGTVLRNITACPAGAGTYSDRTCSLSPSTVYYYRISYSIGNWTSPVRGVFSFSTTN